MGTWNYRIIDFGTHRALHEVHYDALGKPRAYTEEPATFVCDPDEKDGIIGALEMALADSKREWLTPADFPAGKKEEDGS